MLWKQYVFRRGADVEDMWDLLFENRPVRLLYIAGRGFDVRAQAVMNAFIETCRVSGHTIKKAELLLIGFEGHQLSEELKEQTEDNANALEQAFSVLGPATRTCRPT
jgi:hypothetical protein